MLPRPRSDLPATTSRSATDAVREAIVDMESTGADDGLFRAQLAVALMALAARVDQLYEELGL